MTNQIPKKVTFAEQVSYDDNTRGTLKSINDPSEQLRTIVVSIIEPPINITVGSEATQIRYSHSSTTAFSALNLELAVNNDFSHSTPQLVGIQSSCCTIS